MILTLEPLKAKEGDCLLLHWGTKDKPKLAVIDGGPGSVFDDFLLPRLEQIRAKRPGQRLIVDLVMVSHVDNDHVVGIKKFFRTLKAEAEKNTPVNKRRFKVERLWHNTFDDILNNDINKHYKTVTASFTASTKEGEPNEEIIKRVEKAFKDNGEDDEDAHEAAHDISLILAGHGEGRELRNLHDFLHKRQEIRPLNHPIKSLIALGSPPKPGDFEKLKVTIVGPMQAQIEALQKAFDKYIEKNGLTAEAVLAAYADKSVPNLSSIVCLVEQEGKRILLTGDARGDFILEGLRKAEILKTGETLKVDVLKVPHHGSGRNLEPGFFETILADTYIFSANGKYGNPDREALEWLIQARGKDAKYKIVLTYKVDEIDAIRKQESKVPWDESKHSLKALFAPYMKKDSKYKFKVCVGEKIELGDEISW